MLGQAFKKETDGMNDYLEEYYLQNNVKEGLSPQWVRQMQYPARNRS